MIYDLPNNFVVLHFTLCSILQAPCRSVSWKRRTKPLFDQARVRRMAEEDRGENEGGGWRVCFLL